MKNKEAEYMYKYIQIFIYIYFNKYILWAQPWLMHPLPLQYKPNHNHGCNALSY